MKLLVVMSDGVVPRHRGPFAVTFDNTYAERFVKHLKDDPTLCTGCGERCVGCRGAYKINYSPDIADVIRAPSALPYYVDHPERHLPTHLPKHDALVAVTKPSKLSHQPALVIDFSNLINYIVTT